MVALLRMTGRAGCPGASLPRAPCLSLPLLTHLSWDRLAGSVRVRGAGYSHSSHSSRLLDPPVQGQASAPRQCRSNAPPAKGSQARGNADCTPRRLRGPARLSFWPGSRRFGPTVITSVGLTERYQFWQLQPTPQSHKSRKTETRAQLLSRLRADCTSHIFKDRHFTGPERVLQPPQIPFGTRHGLILSSDVPSCSSRGVRRRSILGEVGAHATGCLHASFRALPPGHRGQSPAWA